MGENLDQNLRPQLRRQQAGRQPRRAQRAQNPVRDSGGPGQQPPVTAEKQVVQVVPASALAVSLRLDGQVLGLELHIPEAVLSRLRFGIGVGDVLRLGALLYQGIPVPEAAQADQGQKPGQHHHRDHHRMKGQPRHIRPLPQHGPIAQDQKGHQGEHNVIGIGGGGHAPPAVEGHMQAVPRRIGQAQHRREDHAQPPGPAKGQRRQNQGGEEGDQLARIAPAAVVSDKVPGGQAQLEHADIFQGRGLQRRRLEHRAAYQAQPEKLPQEYRPEGGQVLRAKDEHQGDRQGDQQIDAFPRQGIQPLEHPHHVHQGVFGGAGGVQGGGKQPPEQGNAPQPVEKAVAPQGGLHMGDGGGQVSHGPPPSAAPPPAPQTGACG